MARGAFSLYWDVMTANDILARLESLGNERNRQGMARFGINVERAYGVSMAEIRRLKKEIPRDHALALALWDAGVHEARILACLVDEPHKVTEEQMERWALDFNSWDLCDQCCGNLFDRTPFAYPKTRAWAVREEEFVRRAGFALMAWLAVHDKKAANEPFLDFLPLIENAASDERNFVKKAVNWALRQIGKRNAALHEKAVETAGCILAQDAKSSRWIARDALREFADEKTLARMRDREAARR